MLSLVAPNSTHSDDQEGCPVVGATLTLSSNSNPVTPLSTSWISALTYHSPPTHLPLELPPQFSPRKSPNLQNLCANFHFSDGVKEKYLSDAAVTTPQSPFYSVASDHSHKSPKVSSKLRHFNKECAAKESESYLMDEYQKLVGDWDYFIIHLRIKTKDRMFEDRLFQERIFDKALMCLRQGSDNVWYFLMHQVFEIVFPDRARSSVRLRMEFLKIRNLKVPGYHLVHKLKEHGCTKLHTGTLKLVRYKDLMRLIISMRRSSRFQTGGSQKSKDAIEDHKRLVDQIVVKLEREDKLFNRRFIRKLISDPSFLNRIISVKSDSEE